MPKRKSASTHVEPTPSTVGTEGTEPLNKKPRIDAHIPISRFGMELFTKYNENECKGRNGLFSPLGLGFGLSMLAFGAEGNSQDQMLNLLHLRLKENIEAVAAMKEDLPEGAVSIANGLLVRKALRVKKEYRENIQRDFFGDIVEVGFGKRGCANKVNHWAARKTNNLIPHVVHGDHTLEGGQQMMLMNCMYFHAEWVHQFRPEDTKAGPFTLSDGTEKTVQYMNGIQKVIHATGPNDKYEAIKLPYDIPHRANKCSMLLFLPPEDQDIDEFVSSLTFEDIHHVIEASKNLTISLKLPKFSLESELLDLSQDLKNLGITNIFEKDNAGLDHIHKGVHLDRVFQKVHVDVDERGTEALETHEEPKSKSHPKTDFVFDRPFVFTIVQDHTSSLLFLGKVQLPEIKEEAQ